MNGIGSMGGAAGGAPATGGGCSTGGCSPLLVGEALEPSTLAEALGGEGRGGIVPCSAAREYEVSRRNSTMP